MKRKRYCCAVLQYSAAMTLFSFMLAPALVNGAEAMGYTVGRSTIKQILAENGIDPAGRRPASWKTFLKAHWGAIAATDFFTIEVITWRGLVRYLVLFVIDLETRQIEVAGIVTSPDGAWMAQIARNWTNSSVLPPSCVGVG